jgi:zinc protease
MKKNILSVAVTLLVTFVSTSAFAIGNIQSGPLSAAAKTAVTVKKPAAASQNVEHYFTSNGLEVILKKITTNDIVGLKLFLKGGTRNLSEKNAGIEKLLLNTMIQASKQYPKDKLNIELAKIGAQIGTDSFFDYSTFSLKSLNKYFDKAFNIFQSLINNPLLENNEVDLQKNRMLSAVRHEIDEPDDYVWKLVNRTFSAGHPYLISYEGEPETIPTLSKADLQNYMKENLVASKMLLVIAGNYNKNIKNDIEKYFAKIPRGNYKSTPVQALNVNKSVVTVEDRDIPTAYIAARFTAPNLRSSDYPAMYLALRILSEKFHETVRTKHGLSYAVSAGSSMREANSGYIYVTTVKPKESIELMYQEIDNLKNMTVDQKYLEGVRNLYYTDYFMNLESNFDQAQNLGFNQMFSGDYNNSYKLIEKFKQVKPEDIKAVMNKYVKNLNFGIIYKKDLIDQSLFTRL